MQKLSVQAQDFPPPQALPIRANGLSVSSLILKRSMAFMKGSELGFGQQLLKGYAELVEFVKKLHSVNIT